MKRRQFITLLGGAVAWPFTARAQQPAAARRIGVLMSLPENDPVGRAETDAFRQGLKDHGWIEGGNVQLDYRWPGGDLDRVRTAAQEVIALKPDVIVARSTPATAELLRETQAIPIVFVSVSEPIASGLVESLGRPGGMVTGFTNVEPSVAGKWMELLKQIAPAVARAAFLFNPETAPFAGSYLRAAENASPTLAMQAVATPVRSVAEMEGALTAIAHQPGSGLVLMPDSFVAEHRDLVIGLAAQYRLPAIYATSAFGASGGLLTYALDTSDLFRRAAAYVDRILKGAMPADLPVQQPDKFELVVNLKTAKALGLTISDTFLARADRVIE